MPMIFHMKKEEMSMTARRPVLRSLFRTFAVAAICISAMPPVTAGAESAATKELVEEGVLIVADPGSSPPSCSIDNTGAATGYFVELTKQFAERIGVGYRFVAIDWPGVLAGLTSGRFDIGGCQVVHTVARLNSSEFVMSTYFSGQGVRLMVPESSSIQEWDQASGLTVGAQKGSTEMVAVQREHPSLKFKEYGGFSEMMLELANGRIDAALGPEIVLNGLIKESGAKLKLVATPIDFTSRGTLFPANHKNLAAEFDSYVGELRASGKLDEMVTKWFGSSIFDWGQIETKYRAVKEEAAAAAAAPK